MPVSSLISAAVLSKLPDLAGKLIQKWNEEDGIDPDKLPNGGTLEEALQQLIKMNLLELGDDFVPDNVLDLVEGAVANFQNRTRRPFTDGIIRRGLIGRLFNAAFCDDKDGRNKSTNKRVTGSAPDPNLYTIKYYVDKTTVPARIGGEASDDLIAEAVQEWTSLTKFLLIDEVDSEAEANLVLKMETIDGNFGVLGKAPVAGPGSFKDLVIRMDAKEEWDADLFRAAVCHEIGHVLGLGHSSHSNQLMSPVIPNSVRIPQDEDRERIQKIYQESDAEEGRGPAPGWPDFRRNRRRNR